MSFEYNGVVYRDLEPQVRYDAEQVQVLKQADVTINENLQTINTELSNKLTKPTNPSAESAVTMLADGTVGTKLLSEIGGGKLYIHRVSLKSGLLKDYQYYITVPSSDATPITKETANRLLYGYAEEIDDQGSYHSSTVKNVNTYESTNEISIDGTLPQMAFAAAIESDTVSER